MVKVKQTSSPWKHINFYKDDEGLENVTDEGNKSLAIKDIINGGFFADKSKNFRGSDLILNLQVMEKIAEGDPKALDSVDGHQPILSSLDGEDA